jgi:LCP family protein required for cell wall assembly
MDSHKTPKKKSGGWKLWIIIIPAILVALSVGFGFFTAFIVTRILAFEMLLSLSPTVNNIPDTNILLLGVDAHDGKSGRSDTLMVVHIDAKTKSIGIVSIPRDTLVVIPGVRLDKINHAFAFGGAELACATTSNFLQVPVSYYIKVNFEGLERLIDRLGGITLDIEKKMYYVDFAGGLYIDLQPGVQVLTGKQAIGYLRFRHDNLSDFGRISRQQKFLDAVATQIKKTRGLSQTYNLILDFAGSVETNLSASQIMGLASVSRQAYESGNIMMTQLPGTGTKIDGVYYLQPDMRRSLL